MQTDAGEFRIAGLPRDAIALEMNAPGYAHEQVPLRGYGPGTHRLDVALYQVRSLEVIARQQDGSPADGSLFVIGPDGRPLRMDLGGGMSTHSVKLLDGRTELWGLPAKTVTAQLEVGGFDQPFDQPFEQPFEQSIDLTTQPVEPLVMTLGAVTLRLALQAQDHLPRRVQGAGDDGTLAAVLVVGRPGQDVVRLALGQAHETRLTVVAREGGPPGPPAEAGEATGCFPSRWTILWTPGHAGAPDWLARVRVEDEHRDGAAGKIEIEHAHLARHERQGLGGANPEVV